MPARTPLVWGEIVRHWHDDRAVAQGMVAVLDQAPTSADIGALRVFGALRRAGFRRRPGRTACIAWPCARPMDGTPASKVTANMTGRVGMGRNMVMALSGDVRGCQ